MSLEDALHRSIEECERLRAERDAYRAVVERLMASRIGVGLSYSLCDAACMQAERVYRVIHREGGASVAMIRGVAGLAAERDRLDRIEREEHAS